jgi:outer membrane receptor protein involved in Fe transport
MCERRSGFVSAAAALLLLSVSASTADAQVTRGAVVGAVTDQSGAVVPNATVELLNVETGVLRATTTAANGDYTFTSVEAGTYQLTISAAGFQTSTISEIRLLIDQTARVDATLQVGDVVTEVEVTGATPVVQSERSEVGSVVDGPQIANMPLNGRGDIYALLALGPGVQRSSSNPLISGGTWVGSTNMTVDGVNANDVGNGRLVGPIPSVDAIDELKVIANGASAEYGSGGAQIVMATKRGSNELHGSAFAFNRDRALSAKNFFATDLPKPPFSRNEFGGSLGGPVIRNTLFFFGSYEGLRLRQSETGVRSMPTAALRSGDFSGLPTITDPLSGAPFPNNRIPANRISPVAMELLEFASEPNMAGTGAAGLGDNLVVTLPRRENMDRYSGRIDYEVTPSDRVTGRYYHVNNGPFVSPGGNATDRFGNWGGFGIATRNLGASYMRVISPSLINEIRFGFNQEENFRTPQNADYDPSSVIPGLISPVEGLGGLPTVNIVGFTGFFDLPGSGDLKRTYQVMDTLTWTHRQHTIKAGFEFARASAFNFQNPPPYRGQFDFDGRYTGHPFADFLFGWPSATGRVSKNVEAEPLNNRWAAYIQDDWLVLPKLTLNLGLRYEYASPLRNARGDMSNFYPELNQIVVLSGTPDPRLMEMLPVVLGSEVGLDASSYINKDRNNFGPRLGFAYRPLGSSRFVVRSSYGIYYNVISNYSQFFMAVNPPFLVTESFEPEPGPLPSLTFENPFPGQGNIPTSPGINAVSQDRRSPYHQQWNLTLEYELLPNTAVRTSYVGNKGTHLERNFNLNDPAPAPGAVQPRRPFQPWGPISYTESGRSSITHQLQLGAVRRLSGGLAFQLEYQFTRALGEQVYGQPPLDNRNTRLDRGNLDFIRRHVLTANYIYELPFGNGKRWGSSMSGIADALFGGWRLAGIMNISSGQPYSVTFTSQVLGWPSGRADIVGDPEPANQTIDQWFNPAAFAEPAEFTFGNSARNMLFGPGFFSWDAGLFKTAQLTDTLRMEVRAEFFNLLNRANFDLPASNISEPDEVGRITSAADGRNIQFGVKLIF